MTAKEITAEPYRAAQRWLWMAGLALLLHVPLLHAIGTFGDSPALVRVTSMDPLPGSRLDIDGEPLEVTVGFTWPDPDAVPNPLGARLYWIHEDGTKELVSFGHFNEDAPGEVRFYALREPGSYVVWLAASGVEPLLQGDLSLDGELTDPRADTLPSGDGEPGGDFVAAFVVAEELILEPLVAHIVTEEPSIPESLGDAPEPEIAPSPAIAVQPPPRPPRQPRPTPPPPEPAKASVVVTPPPIVADELPRRADPKKDESAPDLLHLSAAESGEIIGEEADRMAAHLAQQSQQDGLLGGWEESLQRTQATLNGSGPKVNPGNPKQVRTHRKEVWAYIALMHKRIHRQWADEFLLGLDFKHRDPRSSLNNPQLSTELEIEVGENGVVTDVQVVSSSGNLVYDSEAIRIAWQSGPSEPVPTTMLSGNSKAYLHWTFWRDQRQCGTFGVKVYVLDNGTRRQVGFDLSKVEAEEDRIGVRNQGVYGGRSTSPTSGGSHNHGDPIPSPDRNKHNVDDEDDHKPATSTPVRQERQRGVR